jgi:hypothetical protein
MNSGRTVYRSQVDNPRSIRKELQAFVVIKDHLSGSEHSDCALVILRKYDFDECHNTRTSSSFRALVSVHVEDPHNGPEQRHL